MFKGMEILCGMLGIDPEQLMTAAVEMKALAESCDRRLAAMEEAIARIEKQLAPTETPTRPMWMVEGDRKAKGL